MDSTVIMIVLTALTAATGALWTRLGTVQRRMEELIRDEAQCRTALENLREEVRQRHGENITMMQRLACVKEQQ